MNPELLNKFVNNRCTSGEVDEVLNWIQQPEEPTREILLKQCWDKINPDKNFNDYLDQQRLDKIHHRINLSQSETNNTGKLRNLPSGNHILSFFFKASAVLLIPVITLFIYTHFFQKDFIASNEITSPPGSRIFLQLSDGTKVWLNNGSKMVYPQKFVGSNRTITLTGEGYFEVAHDAGNPFIVEANGMRIKATGTAFNVKAYNDGSDFEATLESGKVYVEQQSSNNSSPICRMVPGQHFTFNRQTNKYKLKKEETYRYIAWKDGKLIFDDDRLDKVAERLSQWYNIKVTLKDPGISQLTFKATFVDESLSQVINMMQVVMPVKCVETKREEAEDGTLNKKEILIYSNDK